VSTSKIRPNGNFVPLVFFDRLIFHSWENTGAVRMAVGLCLPDEAPRKMRATRPEAGRMARSAPAATSRTAAGGYRAWATANRRQVATPISLRDSSSFPGTTASRIRLSWS